jgi:hypothetical protein
MCHGFLSEKIFGLFCISLSFNSKPKIKIEKKQNKFVRTSLLLEEIA